MDDLPNELLIYIVDHLRGPTTWAEPADYSRTHALAALCCVSKKLYHITRPLLYESIDLPPNDGVLPQSRRLFARLQEQPSLRLEIKALRQKTPARLRRDGERRMRVRDEYMKDTTRDVRAFGLGTEDASALVGRWLEYEDLYFALVAFRTPNLERLWARSALEYQGLYDDCNNTLLEGIGRMAMGLSRLHTHRFDNLKILYFDFSKTPQTPARYAFPLLLLPNLDELTLVALGGYFDMAENETEVGFEYDDADGLIIFGRPWFLPAFLPPSITSLHIHYPREPNDEADQQLVDVLSAHKDGTLASLKDVYITWVYYQRGEEEFDLLERLQSLVQIKAQYEASSITDQTQLA
ncbi:uncharacterized protein J4E78_005110 [Alternaria triticimaculans]|uniref:uncharacterized protein n=1 Tax=Alternaria triticimaculans TaxID=297637 RepID=UPI0020C468DA|nr:uncharacterized protein J4E78_005110 [Alternaria triticimaculans]KAI4660407.1 hypothetical protein J4E78_005110 [Alternaria triticimaculans]